MKLHHDRVMLGLIIMIGLRDTYTACTGKNPIRSDFQQISLAEAKEYKYFIFS